MWGKTKGQKRIGLHLCQIGSTEFCQTGKFLNARIVPKINSPERVYRVHWHQCIVQQTGKLQHNIFVFKLYNKVHARGDWTAIQLVVTTIQIKLVPTICYKYISPQHIHIS